MELTTRAATPHTRRLFLRLSLVFALVPLVVAGPGGDAEAVAWPMHPWQCGVVAYYGVQMSEIAHGFAADERTEPFAEAATDITILLAISQAEFTAYGLALTDVVQRVRLVQPPSLVVGWHGALIGNLELYRDLFLSAGRGEPIMKLAADASEYMNSLHALLSSEALRVIETCPSFADVAALWNSEPHEQQPQEAQPTRTPSVVGERED